MEIFKLFGRIAVDNAEANQALDETTQKAAASGKETSSAFGSIGKAALTVGKTVVTAGAAVGGAWIAAIEGSREYRVEMGKLDTAFTTNGHSSTAAKETYQALQAVLGDSAVSVEAANHLAVLTDNEKDLQTWTNICTGVFATFGDSLPIEGLTEAANETAKTGVLTGGLTDALNWAGISEEAFQKKLDSCTTEQERQKLIMDTLNDTYKEASATYQTTNADVMEANRANERLSAALAEVGRVGEPILTAIKDKVAQMVEVAVPKIESFIQKVKDLKKWIKDNENTIDAWVAVIVGATTSIAIFLVAMKWGTILGAATKAITACRAALILFNATIKANPIGFIISLLVGLVAAFITLWKNNEQFRAFWINLWAKIKSTCGTAVSWVKGKFNDLKAAFSVVKNVFGNIQKTIAEKMEAARKKVSDVIGKIKGFFNFSFKWPKVPLPHFSVSPKGWKVGDLLKGVKPSLGIDWYAEGGILTKPTLFGMSDTGRFLGGGEAGAEAVAPISVLQEYVAAAVRSETEGMRATLIEQTQALIDFLSRAMPQSVVLDSGAMVGELIPAVDIRLSDRWKHAQRGNTR